MGKLTETQIQQWIQGGKPVAIADGGGLTFTLSKVGTAAWTLRYRIGGKERELTLGRYPTIDLESARTLAEIERAKIALGRDVAGEKRERRNVETGGRRVEMLRREIVKLESDLRRLELAAKATRTRLDAACLALQIESESEAE